MSFSDEGDNMRDCGFARQGGYGVVERAFGRVAAHRNTTVTLLE
jgi:hypothetical protein